MKPPWRQVFVLLAFSLLFILLPYLLERTSSAYLIRLFGTAGLTMLLALGLNVVIGFVGLLDLGFMAFYAIGAYTAALLAIQHVPFWLCTLAAIGTSALARLVVGFPALRLRGDYLAIVTLGFGEVVRLIITNWDLLTNGPKGLPRLGEALLPPKIFGFAIETNLHFYYLILSCVILAVWICVRLDRSRVGRAWVAIREDEIAAELMGIEVTKQKVMAFGLSAIFAGIAGSIFVHWQRFVTPESFTFWDSILLVCAVVLGGMGSITGVLLGSAAIVALPELLRQPLGDHFVNARYLLFGFALVLMAIYRPQGLWPSRRRSLELGATESEERPGSLFDVKGNE